MRAFLDMEYRLTMSEVHACHWLDLDACFSFGIATTLQVSDVSEFSLHVDDCERRMTEAKPERKELERQPSNESIEVGGGLKALGKTAVRRAIVPFINAVLARQMSASERYPEIDEMHEPTLEPRIPGERFVVALPTWQATYYKKKLKESPGRPTKKTKPAEQHFDYCGDGISSISGLTYVAEGYCDSIAFLDEPSEAFVATERYDYNLSDVTEWFGIDPSEDKVMHVDGLNDCYNLFATSNVARTHVARGRGRGDGRTRKRDNIVDTSWIPRGMFDCVVGIDLMRHDDELALYDYTKGDAICVGRGAPVQRHGRLGGDEMPLRTQHHTTHLSKCLSTSDEAVRNVLVYNMKEKDTGSPSSHKAVAFTTLKNGIC